VIQLPISFFQEMTFYQGLMADWIGEGAIKFLPAYPHISKIRFLKKEG